MSASPPIADIDQRRMNVRQVPRIRTLRGDVDPHQTPLQHSPLSSSTFDRDWLLLVSGLIAIPVIVIRDCHAQGAVADEANPAPSVELCP